MSALNISDLTVCYTITPDLKWRSRAAEAIFSLVRTNPGVRVQVTETDGGDYPIGIKHAGMMRELDTAWALFLDADTQVCRPLSGLSVSDDVNFYGRPETMWVRGRIRHPRWAAICEKAAQPIVPVFNSGAFLLPGWLAHSVGAAWPSWMAWLKANASDPLEEREAARRGPWWMLEQCALSLAVAPLIRGEWTAREHSYQWQSESPGIIHHYSSKRWHPFLEGLK